MGVAVLMTSSKANADTYHLYAPENEITDCIYTFTKLEIILLVMLGIVLAVTMAYFIFRMVFKIRNMKLQLVFSGSGKRVNIDLMSTASHIHTYHVISEQQFRDFRISYGPKPKLNWASCKLTLINLLDKSVIVMDDNVDISLMEANKLKKIFRKRFIINLISKHGNKTIPVNFCNKTCNICQPILKTHQEQERIKN